MSYSVPQALVFQESNQVPSELTDPLRPHISGGHAQLFRYSDADEKAQVSLGEYDPDNDTNYTWPGRAAGAIVDESFVKLFIDDALLELFTDLIADPNEPADQDLIEPVSGFTNRVRSTGTGAFQTNSYASRFAALGDRDVQVGDVVKLDVSVSGTTYELTTYITDIKGEPIAAAIGTPTADANNPADTTASSTVTPDAGNQNTDLTLTVDHAAWNAYLDGLINETYTVEIISGSTGNDLTTATMRITSASGLDDVASAAPAANGASTSVGRRNLTLTFSGVASDLVAGDKYTVAITGDYEPPNLYETGTYTGDIDTTYIVDVTRGGLFADTDPDKRPQISVTTIHGNDVSGPVTVPAVATDMPIGTKGVNLAFYGSDSAIAPNNPDPLAGLRQGDRFYVPVTTAKEGRMSTLVLAHSLPSQMQSASDLNLRIYLKKNIEVPQIGSVENWSTSATEISVKAGITAQDSTATNGGVEMDLPVKGGAMYVEYRAWLPDLSDSIYSVSDVDSLDSAISGPLVPDNPLKWGVYKALLNSNGTAVRFTAVADPDDPNSWLSVLDLTGGRDDLYNLVPLTRNQTVLDAYAGHVDSQSSPEKGRWKAMFVSLKGNDEKMVIGDQTSSDGNTVLATLADDPDTSGTQYTRMTITSGNAQLISDGVKAGDTVRYLFTTSYGKEVYSTFTVDTVISETELRLVSGPGAPETTARRVEIWHPLSAAEQASDIGQQAAAYGNSRVCAVWPDLIDDDGQLTEGYYLCAALAGLIGGVVPHQGLTNVEIAGFEDVTRTVDMFSDDQLNTMAASGVWIVTRTRSGAVVTRHALTTNTSSLDDQEEMFRRNRDAVSYVLLRRIEPFIGRTNVTPSALDVIRVNIQSGIEFLKSNGYTATLGSQLIDGSIREIRPHLVLKDRVVAVLDLVYPYPNNNVELYLVG